MMILCRNAERTSQIPVETFGTHLMLLSFRFLVRDFKYSEEAVTKQREDLAMADVTEKELWVTTLIL
jgi:hypothetical protein